MAAKAEINKKNAAFRAELRAAMERQGIRNWRELIIHWGLPEPTGYGKLKHPERLTVGELRVLCAVLRMSDEDKGRLTATL